MAHGDPQYHARCAVKKPKVMSQRTVQFTWHQVMWIVAVSSKLWIRKLIVLGKLLPRQFVLGPAPEGLLRREVRAASRSLRVLRSGPGRVASASFAVVGPSRGCGACEAAVRRLGAAPSGCRGGTIQPLGPNLMAAAARRPSARQGLVPARQIV